MQQHDFSYGRFRSALLAVGRPQVKEDELLVVEGVDGGSAKFQVQLGTLPAHRFDPKFAKQASRILHHKTA